MPFGDLLAKVADNQPLSPAEREQLRLQGNNLELLHAALAAILTQNNVFTGDNVFQGEVSIEQGGVIIDEGGISAGSGNVVIGLGGIRIANNVSALLFEDSSGNATMMIGSNLANFLYMQNDVPGAGIINFVALADGVTFPYTKLWTDPSDNSRTELDLVMGPNGARLSVGGRAELLGYGGSGGYDALRLRSTPNTPAMEYTANDEITVYLKSNKIVVQFKDGATTRYKYLDLTGTGVTWVHTTTPP